MFNKLAVIVFVAFSAAPGGAATDTAWTGLTAKWNFPILDPFRWDSFFTVPQTYDTAVAEGWTSVTGATNVSDVTALAYEGELSYLIFCNTTSGKVVGFQPGFPVADVVNVPLDYDNFPGITRKTLNGIDYYTGAMWYQTNDDGSRQLAYEDQGELIEIPTDTTELLATTPYLEKKCIYSMGTHYYRVNSTSTPEEFFPWSYLADEGVIVGALFQAIGSSTATGRQWFEDIESSVVKFVIPDAPDSLLLNMDDYGVRSVHSYFVKNPLGIFC